jgi:hypothetical protein
MGRTTLVVAFALALVASAPSEGWAKVAHCRIESAGLPPFNGQCQFESSSDGSFGLSSVDASKPFLGDVESVGVVIVSPGVAEVRGLTRWGSNSRWGEAHRSARDPACWAGVDFRICAY